MTRTLYDSTNAFDIPTFAEMVGGYVDGRFKWEANEWARFPNAVHVPIAVFPTTNDGVVLDVERGDATPEQAPGWVQRRRAAGVDPTVYCSESDWTPVIKAFVTAGVAQPHYWIAHYDGDPHIPVGAIAKQYINPPASGGHWDLSVVADYWPGVDKKVEDDMAGGRYPLTVDNKAGRAWATFTTHSKSQVLDAVYVDLRSLWSDLTGCRGTWLFDDGTFSDVVTDLAVTQNHRVWWPAPDGATGVTFEWSPGPVVVDGGVEFTTK